MTWSTRSRVMRPRLAEKGGAGEASALLVDRAAHLDASQELDSRAPQALRGVDRRGDPGLHVRGAAAVDSPVANDPAERVHGPSVARGNDVEMAVQMDERTLAPAAAETDHVHARMRVGVLRIALGDEIVDLEAKALELPSERFRGLSIGVSRRVDARDPDQLRGEVDDLVPGALDFAADRFSSHPMPSPAEEVPHADLDLASGKVGDGRSEVGSRDGVHVQDVRLVREVERLDQDPDASGRLRPGIPSPPAGRC